MGLATQAGRGVAVCLAKLLENILRASLSLWSLEEVRIHVKGAFKLSSVVPVGKSP